MSSGWRLSSGRLHPQWVIGGGVVLTLLALVLGSTQGAYAIAPSRLLSVLWDGLLGNSTSSTEHLVFMNIRLPRLLLGLVAGAGLGLAGALMQGMFRNPLADPGLIGVSGGAALAADSAGGSDSNNGQANAAADAGAVAPDARQNIAPNNTGNSQINTGSGTTGTTSSGGSGTMLNPDGTNASPSDANNRYVLFGAPCKKLVRCRPHLAVCFDLVRCNSRRAHYHIKPFKFSEYSFTRHHICIKRYVSR